MPSNRLPARPPPARSDASSRPCRAPSASPSATPSSNVTRPALTSRPSPRLGTCPTRRSATSYGVINGLDPLGEGPLSPRPLDPTQEALEHIAGRTTLGDVRQQRIDDLRLARPVRVPDGLE